MTGAGDITNIVLDPIYIFVFRLGVSDAAIAHFYLSILTSSFQIRFCAFDESHGCHILCDAGCIYGLNQGPIPMASFQVCLQIWVATSFLADGLAVAGQVKSIHW
ncbi:hypothetical protein POM88_043602 [Heracleum sosnowskyi]|uniref:Uncharacterized protein n=1 Tax=Heracleum sosnowskyi TaxID=360622 RepID=A0AAD8H3N3_9APIA|nr:hypothetical protein POM88_043602 [Heracleum sosnowskyi]